MRLVVFSHKPCWSSPRSESGVATDGGFAFQMAALSELFDMTTVLVPVTGGERPGEAPLQGTRLGVTRLPAPMGAGVWRKVLLPVWFLRCVPTLLRAVRASDAIHAPIPGDIGTVGIVLAHLFRKPLFVRHCGNWTEPKTSAERGWRWYMERFAGGRNAMLATGGALDPPSWKNEHIRWIFSTSLSASQLAALRRERRPPGDRGPRLITVCRQVHAKGTATAIAATAQLVPDMPDIHLDIVGVGPDLDAFKKQARATGAARAFTFHGALNHDEVMATLAAADILVFPTRSSEGFPKVVVEAMAVGLPIICSAVSVLPTLARAGAGVALDDPGVDQVAGAIRDLSGDHDRYLQMSAAAVDQASRLSLEQWGESIRDHLERAWSATLRSPCNTTAALRGRS